MVILKDTIKNLNEDLSKLKYDLKLIKVREGFHGFIEYFFRIFGFEGLLNYNTKIYEISRKLKEIKANNFNLIKHLLILFEGIYTKLNTGNISAHDIKFDKPVIEQIFECLDFKTFSSELIKKLRDIQAEKFIKDLIIIRKKFYYDRKIVEEQEKKIYNNLPNWENYFL